MSKVSNLNYNNVSVKTDSMVKMIKELSKLGVFKKKKRTKRPSKVADGDSIRQDSSMVGYTKTIPTLLAVPPGATLSQIEDVQRRNDAIVARLRAEVQQQRLEDLQNLGQTFQQIGQTRFRESPQQESTPFRQTATVIQLPDINEEATSFNQSPSPGAPDVKVERSTDVYPEEEPETELTTAGELAEGVAFAEVEEEEPLTGGGASKPIPRSRGAPIVAKRAAVAADFSLPPPPPVRGTSRPEMFDYYVLLAERTQNPINPKITNNIEKMFSAINKILDEYILPN